MPYQSVTQQKNLAWFLPRPKPDKYLGGMPLYCENWLIELAKDLLGQETIKLLNVFCGMNQQGLRVDLREAVNPDVVCDAHQLCQTIHDQFFDVILADPPYSAREAKQLYGTPRLSYKRWTKECVSLLRPGGLLIVYHKYLMPNPDPLQLKVEKRVFIGSRLYHLPRVAIYFRKQLSIDENKNAFQQATG